MGDYPREVLAILLPVHNLELGCSPQPMSGDDVLSCVLLRKIIKVLVVIIATIVLYQVSNHEPLHVCKDRVGFVGPQNVPFDVLSEGQHNQQSVISRKKGVGLTHEWNHHS